MTTESKTNIDLDRLAETLWRASGEVPDRYSFRLLPAVTRQYWQRIARAALTAVGGKAGEHTGESEDHHGIE